MIADVALGVKTVAKPFLILDLETMDWASSVMSKNSGFPITVSFVMKSVYTVISKTVKNYAITFESNLHKDFLLLSLFSDTALAGTGNLRICLEAIMLGVKYF